MQQTQLIQEVHALNENIKEMTMRLNALLVKEVEATPEEKRAAEIGKRQFREGKYITLDQLRAKKR